MKKICFVLCTVLLLSLCAAPCAFAVSAENEGPMDEFDDTAVRGDINGNGARETTDYMMLKRFILGTYTLSANEQSRADVNLDGEVSPVDYMVLKRVILGTYSF